MPKRFLAVLLFAALVAIPAAIPSAASAFQNVSSSAKRAHDWTRPVVRIKRAAGQSNPTSQSAVRFTVSFSESVRGFSAAGVRLSGTAKAKRVKVARRGNRRSFSVTVAGVKRPGTIVATIRTGAARDAAGNLSMAGNRIKVLAVIRKSQSTKKTSHPKPTSRVPAPTTTTPTTTTPTTTTPTTTTPTTTTPTSPPASTGLIVGTINNVAGGGSLAQVVASGAKWIREDLFWPDVEPTKGKQDWRLYDNLFLTTAQKCITVLPIIDGIPTWSSGSAATWTMPADPSDYATFAGQATARYGPGGTFWQAHSDLAQYAPVYFEIWNEPYIPVFSQPATNPGRYARMYRAASIAGHAANSAARFIMEIDWQYQTANGSWRIWLDDMFAAVPDLAAYVDAVSVHPYANSLNGIAVDSWTGNQWQTERVDKADRPLLKKYGLGDKPVWITEMGWSTVPNAPGNYTEAEQATNLAAFDNLVRTQWTYVKAVFYYHLADYPGADPTDFTQWYGFIRGDGTPKPGYDLLNTLLASSS